MHRAKRAWAGLAAGVVIYDGVALYRGWPTMSAAFGRGLEDPTHRRWIVPLATYVNLHLFGVIRDEWDPLRRWAPQPRTLNPDSGRADG